MFKILTNIITAKNDDINDMVRYLVEDTPLITFLIKHGPKVLITTESTLEQSQKASEEKVDSIENKV